MMIWHSLRIYSQPAPWDEGMPVAFSPRMCLDIMILRIFQRALFRAIHVTESETKDVFMVIQFTKEIYKSNPHKFRSIIHYS